MKSGVEMRSDAITRRLPVSASVVEVGVLRGDLARHLLRRHPSIHRYYLVDNWLPSERQPERYKATGDTVAFASRREADENRNRANEVARRDSRTCVLWGPSTEIAEEFPNWSQDLVFLDADHSYQAVREDIAAWVPKIRKGGWIGGHDYRNPEPGFDFTGVERAVDEWARENSVPIETDDNFTWFARVPA